MIYISMISKQLYKQLSLPHLCGFVCEETGIAGSNLSVMEASCTWETNKTHSVKGVGSLTSEIGPLFGRTLKVRFTFFLWSTLEKRLKLDVCVFIISFRRFSNAKFTAENTYHDRVWLFLAVFVCSSINLCMSTGVDNL